MSFTPSEASALKLITDFESGSKFSEVKLKSTSRISGAFPLPFELVKSNPTTPFLLKRRTFDDTILNRNESLLKKRCFERRLSNDDSNDSINDSVVLASPWEMRKLNGELIQAKAEIMALEARCNKLFNLRKEELLLYEQEKNSFKQSTEHDRKTIADFEIKLKKMRKKELQLKEELEDKTKQLASNLNATEDRNKALAEENRNLKAKISELELKQGESTRELNTAVAELSSAKEELKMTIEQISKLQAQVADLKVTERQHKLDKASLLTAQRKIAELESAANNELSSMLKEQEGKLIRMSEMERQLNLLKTENINLRDAPNKIIKLNSEVLDLKARLADLESTEVLLKKAKVDLGLALNELNEYRSLSRCIAGETASHLELNRVITEMRHASTLAHADISSLQAKLKTAEENNQVSATTCSNLKDEVAKLQSEMAVNASTVKRLKKLLAFVICERDDLRKLLDSMQKETTMACVDSKVEALERLVDGYQQRFSQIEQEIVGNLLGTQLPQSENLTTLENLRKKNAELMQRIEKLEYELEHRNLKGDFDTRDTKILHMKMNPTSVMIAEREDALEKAQSEIEILKGKIKILQESQNTSHCANITQLAADQVQELHSKELDELREKVKSQEIQNQRLMEVFKTTSREFREAIYALLGYNVSSVQNKKIFKLTSMYADSPDHHLLFQMLPEGGMELLETEMSKSVVDLIELHLCHNHSIPTFLSALTMQLFNMHSQSTIIP